MHHIRATQLIRSNTTQFEGHLEDHSWGALLANGDHLNWLQKKCIGKKLQSYLAAIIT